MQLYLCQLFTVSSLFLFTTSPLDTSGKAQMLQEACSSISLFQLHRAPQLEAMVIQSHARHTRLADLSLQTKDISAYLDRCQGDSLACIVVLGFKLRRSTFSGIFALQGLKHFEGQTYASGFDARAILVQTKRTCIYFTASAILTLPLWPQASGLMQMHAPRGT